MDDKRREAAIDVVMGRFGWFGGVAPRDFVERECHDELQCVYDLMRAKELLRNFVKQNYDWDAAKFGELCHEAERLLSPTPAPSAQRAGKSAKQAAEAWKAKKSAQKEG